MSTNKPAKACAYCNKKKIKCKFTDSHSTCDSCAAFRIECTPRMRKRPRRAHFPTPDAPCDPQNGPKSQDRFWGERSSVPLMAEESQGALTPLLSLQGAKDKPQALPDSAQYASWPGRDERWPPDHTGIPRSSVTSNIPDLHITSDTRSQRVSPIVSVPLTRMSSDVIVEQQKIASDQPEAESATYIGRAHYIGEDTPIDEKSVRSYPTNRINDLSETGRTVLELFKSFELPPRSIRQSLIDSFIKYCHPWTPILSRVDLETSEKRVPSLLLMQALFLAASRVSCASRNLSFATSEQYYQRAKALFYMNAEPDPITVIQSTIMLQWYTPDGPEHVSYDTGEFWLKLGVGIAFQVGLHREPNPGRNSAMRRRLWWSLVVRDALMTFGHGRPRAINLEDANVRPLCQADFENSITDGLGDFFIPYAEVCCLLGDLTEACSRNSLSRVKRSHYESILFRWPRVLPEYLRLSLERDDSGNYTPLSYNFNARQLHLPYLVSLAILGRSASTGMVSPQAILAASFIAGIAEEFLVRDEIKFVPAIFGSHCAAAGIFLVSVRPFPELWEAAQPDLEIIQSCLKEHSKRWRSAIGNLKALQWILKARRNENKTSTMHPVWLSSEQQQFFDGYALDLCRMWGPYEKVAKRAGEGNSDPMGIADVQDYNGNGLLGRRQDRGVSANHPAALYVSRDSMDLEDQSLTSFQFEGLGSWFVNEWGTGDIWDRGFEDDGMHGII